MAAKVDLKAGLDLALREGPKLASPFRLHLFDSLDSTNEEARRLAEAGARDGTVVMARRQESGRGRRGRPWVSEPGNLYISFIFRPEDPPSRAAELGFVAANATADAIQHFCSRATQVTVKWPNDVLIEGAKVAGILLESSGGPEKVDWLVAGIGVNIDHHPADTPYPATHLNHERERDEEPLVSANVFAETLVLYLGAGLVNRRRVGFSAIRRDWLRRAHGLGKPLQARLFDRTLEGVFKGLDGTGALLLEDAGGTVHTLTAADVFWPPFSSPPDDETRAHAAGD
ncbi:MAG: biotin--[acetyl-CoA-carboxylase] ligase [Magnetovibrionaceae bacterium]